MIGGETYKYVDSFAGILCLIFKIVFYFLNIIKFIAVNIIPILVFLFICGIIILLFVIIRAAQGFTGNDIFTQPPK
jgi:hypothetical protein